MVEERQVLKRLNRTRWNKCRLYFLRIIINSFVLIILGGAAYLIYFTTDFAVLVSAIQYQRSINAIMSLLVSDLSLMSFCSQLIIRQASMKYLQTSFCVFHFRTHPTMPLSIYLSVSYRPSQSLYSIWWYQ